MNNLKVGDKVSFNQGSVKIIGIIKQFKLNNRFAVIRVISEDGKERDRYKALLVKVEQLEKIKLC